MILFFLVLFASCFIVKLCPRVWRLAFLFLLPVFFRSFSLTRPLFPPHSPAPDPLVNVSVYSLRSPSCLLSVRTVMPPFVSHLRHLRYRLLVSPCGMFRVSVPWCFHWFALCFWLLFVSALFCCYVLFLSLSLLFYFIWISQVLLLLSCFPGIVLRLGPRFAFQTLIVTICLQYSYSKYLVGSEAQIWISY